MAKEPHRYALQKVFISWSSERNIAKGDVVLFYRTGEVSPKKYSSVLTTICIVEEIKHSFSTPEN